jgi:phosphopantothenate-cysteine ligase
LDIDKRVVINGEKSLQISTDLDHYKYFNDNNRIVSVSFETVDEYLSILQHTAEILSPLSRRVCFYLAAAVSDFYVPLAEVCYLFG